MWLHSIYLGIILVLMAFLWKKRSARVALPQLTSQSGKAQIQEMIKNLSATFFSLHRSFSQIKTANTQLKDLSQSQDHDISKINEVIAETCSMIHLAMKDLHCLEQSIEVLGSSTQKSFKAAEDLQSSSQELLGASRTLMITADELHQLRESADIIGDISLSTKILSFNAAIEAERAGEFGKGFAVVAKEIQDLSLKTKEAATFITDIVSSKVKEVEGASQRLSGIAEDQAKLAQATLEGQGAMRQNLHSSEQRLVQLRQRMNESSADLSKLEKEIVSLQKGSETSLNISITNESTTTTMQGFVESMDHNIAAIVETMTGTRIRHIEVGEAYKTLSQFKVIDVRGPQEFNDELGHIQGAQLMTLDERLQEKIKSLDPNENYLIVCRSGGRSARAAGLFQPAGFAHITNLKGGMLAWNAAKLPVSSSGHQQLKAV